MAENRQHVENYAKDLLASRSRLCLVRAPGRDCSSGRSVYWHVAKRLSSNYLCLSHVEWLESDINYKILDQLGVLKELYKRAVRKLHLIAGFSFVPSDAGQQLVIWMSDRDKEGRLIAPRSDTTRLGAARSVFRICIEEFGLMALS
jgi:transposase